MAATGRLLALAALATAARASQFFAGAHPNVRPVGRWAHGSGNGTVYADWSSLVFRFISIAPFIFFGNPKPQGSSLRAPSVAGDLPPPWRAHRRTGIPEPVATLLPPARARQAYDPAARAARRKQVICAHRFSCKNLGTLYVESTRSISRLHTRTLLAADHG